MRGTYNQHTSRSVSVAELDDRWTRAEAQTLMDIHDVLEHSQTDAVQSIPFQVVRRKKGKVNSGDRGSRTTERNLENNYLKALKTNAAKNQNDNSIHSRTSSQAKLKPRVIGTKRQLNSTSSHRVKAARPILPKSVYCVDNVSVEIKEKDLTSFVADQGIHVISCFKVKPRLTAQQRRNNISPTYHNTFRIYILKQDSSKLLQADIWPSSISISPWLFKVQQLLLMTTTAATTATSPGTTHQTPAWRATVDPTSMANSALASPATTTTATMSAVATAAATADVAVNVTTIMVRVAAVTTTAAEAAVAQAATTTAAAAAATTFDAVVFNNNNASVFILLRLHPDDKERVITTL